EPPIPRYVQAALFLMPSFFAVLCWERCVVLLAAGFGRPFWYGQCLVACPDVPDAPRPIAWRNAFRRWTPQRRGAIAITVSLLLGVALAGWTSRDNRFFHHLAKHPEKVRSAILASSDYNAWRASDGASVLHYAALQGDDELVAHLLSDELLRDAVTQDGATALHWAAMGDGKDTTITALTRGGLSPNTPGPLGLSPVHLAALFGNESALSALLEHGGDPNLRTMGYVAPLHLVQSTGAASVLLDNGAAVDVPDGSKATPFMWAPTQKLAAFFLKRGADINAKENWRSFIRQGTPLHKAVYQGDEARTRWLLDHGADPNPGDINNFSPLFYAMWRGNYALIAMLVDQGAEVDHPGHWLAFDRENPTFRYTDIYGKTIGRHPKRDTFAKLVPDGVAIRPVDWAAFLGNPDLIRALVKRGASLKQHNEEGMSALHWALLAQRGKAAKLLRSMAPTNVFDSEALPVAAFEAAVALGHRSLAPVNNPENALPAKRTGAKTIPRPTAMPAPEPSQEKHQNTPTPRMTTDGEQARLRQGLEAAAKKVVDEYNGGAPNILEAADGFLFTRQACRYLLQADYRYHQPGNPASGPSPAFASITDIHRQLAARGIHLIVVPTPMAIEVHVDAFYPDWDMAIPAFPPRGDFIRALQEGGVDAIDLLPDFLSYRVSHPGAPLYLKEDGHWNSTAIGIATEILSKKIRDGIAAIDLDTVAYHSEVIEHRVVRPHIVKRLPGPRRAPYMNVVWDVTRVLREDGTPYQDDDQSPVLVVGDSYTLIFNELSGHLSARLAAALGRPVASHLGNAAGPIIPRVLARKGKEYIDARKVIIWVFSSGYLRSTHKSDTWGMVELP
ncbi:MAG: ankyrin repeat domain-containing protein, partial [Candidatus Hydrogenedentes bacterium]|nr:ankyrin repeat domain-containing protein [Candidatus Hydrogenedentota bacterium]